MKYMGSKNRIARDILPIILHNRKPLQWYVEPFVGGGNMIDKVSGKRLGSDANPYVIEALLSIRDNVNDLPKNNREFTESDYKLLGKSSFKHSGFANFAYSYAGKFKGGWARGDGRDYVEEAYKNAVKQSKNLQGTSLLLSSYDLLEIPKKSIIYCDPPYENTTGYADKFDHASFWNWCREKSKEGHSVFISEYKAPNDFICLWQKEQVSSLTQDTGNKKAVEKLFIYNQP